MKRLWFHVIKLIKCDRTCQRSITIINKEKSFTPNKSPLSHYSLLNFCLKESSRRDLSQRACKNRIYEKMTFFSRGWYLNKDWPVKTTVSRHSLCLYPALCSCHCNHSTSQSSALLYSNKIPCLNCANSKCEFHVLYQFETFPSLFFT